MIYGPGMLIRFEEVDAARSIDQNMSSIVSVSVTQRYSSATKRASSQKKIPVNPTFRRQPTPSKYPSL